MLKNTKVSISQIEFKVHLVIIMEGFLKIMIKMTTCPKEIVSDN